MLRRFNDRVRTAVTRVVEAIEAQNAEWWARDRRQFAPCEFWDRMWDGDAVPRPIPAGAKVTFFLGPWSNLAALAFALLACLSAVFRPFDPCVEAWDFAGEVRTAKAVVTESRPSKASVNRDRVHRIESNFEVDGVTTTAVSYRTGLGLPVGTAVTVEYPSGRPDRGRIRGLRRNPMGWIATAVLAGFAAFPACFLIGVIMYQSVQLDWFRRGVARVGTLKSVDVLGGGDDVSYRCHFEVDVGGTTFERSVTTWDRCGLPSVGRSILLLHRPGPFGGDWRIVKWPNNPPPLLRLDSDGELRLSNTGRWLAFGKAVSFAAVSLLTAAAFFLGPPALFRR